MLTHRNPYCRILLDQPRNRIEGLAMLWQFEGDLPHFAGMVGHCGTFGLYQACQWESRSVTGGDMHARTVTLVGISR